MVLESKQLQKILWQTIFLTVIYPNLGNIESMHIVRCGESK